MLVGRDDETAGITALLDGSRQGRSGVLVLRGEPGIGKTALLEYAADHAGDAIVLRARGAESESELPFAGLADLLRPILGQLAVIPAPQAAALSGALAIGPPAPGDRFTVCAATLSLMSAAAEQRPVLALVDDAHWLDAPSLEAILFTGRRLGAEGVALLVATRPEEVSAIDVHGLATLELTGLGPEASRQLVAQSTQALSPAMVDRVVEATEGNPLGLMEIPALVGSGDHGLEGLTEPLPAGSRLLRALQRRFDRLPPDTRRALLVTAASHNGDLSVVAPAVVALGLQLSALQPAEEGDVIRVDGTRVEFRHPLLRSAAYHGAPTTARVEAHRALASVLAGADGDAAADARAWHLAAGALTPDASVAAELEAAGDRARRRGAYAAAAASYERAARLTPAPDERPRRLLQAGRAHRLAGRSELAQHLLSEALTYDTDVALHAQLQHQLANVLMWRSVPMEAHRLLVDEAARIEAVDPAKAAAMYTDAVMPCFMEANSALALQTAERAYALARGVGGAVADAAAMLLVVASVLRGRSADVDELIEQVTARLDAGDDLGSAQSLVLYANSLMWLERYGEADHVLGRVISMARGASAVGLLPFALATQSELSLRTGDWTTAAAAGAEGMRLAEETGQGQAYSLVCLARVEAVLGREEETRLHVATARQFVEPLGVYSMQTYTNTVIGLLELGLGNAEAAIAALEEVAEAVALQEVVEPTVIQWLPDLVEAYARAGRPAEARRALDRLADQAGARTSAWMEATVARGEALLAEDGDDADRSFARSVDVLEHAGRPFELARTLLCHGESLRRRKRRIEARVELRRALEIFEDLGAAPWAERAGAELRATGETARRRQAGPSQQLTAQELQVALVVAKGHTNTEAAAALFLSPKTIEFHLGHVYRKLGVKSRTDLGRALQPERVGAGTAR